MHAGNLIESPPQQQQNVTHEAIFQKSGGLYSGPLLADIEKSIKEAHREGGAVKRKFREEAPVTHVSDLSIGKIGNLIGNQFPTSPLCEKQV
jgi:hypothetical protein